MVNVKASAESFQKEFNLEDRALAFLMLLVSCLAMQAALFFKLFHKRFIGATEKMSDVLNGDWKFSEYLSKKLGSFSWITDVVKGAFQKI